MVIGLAECPQKQQHAKNRGGKSTSKKNADASPARALGTVDADSWYCDSGATRHITPSKHYFVSYTKFSNPETIILGKKNVLMQAYGQGMINIQIFRNGRWLDAILKIVWYVPDASAHLFSIRAAAQNGYSTTLNEEGVMELLQHQEGLLMTSM